MSYGKFISFNLIGGLMWVSLFVFGGYMFGNLPMVRDNFHYTVLVIVLISVIPIGLEVIKSKRKENKAI